MNPVHKRRVCTPKLDKYVWSLRQHCIKNWHQSIADITTSLCFLIWGGRWWLWNINPPTEPITFWNVFLMFFSFGKVEPKKKKTQAGGGTNKQTLMIPLRDSEPTPQHTVIQISPYTSKNINTNGTLLGDSCLIWDLKEMFPLLDRRGLAKWSVNHSFSYWNVERN